MEKRENALREALQTNAVEIERWEHFCKENETAIENMDMFSKRLTVDVMVPVGSKAYMPGQLVHTNEVLVGHYQGYFSKCSVHIAKSICEQRISMAKEHLKKLNAESKFWENKLEKPYAEGVLPNAEQLEIIEDYDEEKEKLWRDEHRILIRRRKERERRAKDNNVEGTESDNEIFRILEEDELLLELEKDLNNLEVEVNDDTIAKLLSGEMRLPPEKTRIGHNVESDTKSAIISKAELAPIEATNNNYLPNPELRPSSNDSRVDSDESDVSKTSDPEEMSDELRMIKEQAEFLSPEDQIGFYEYQIQIIKQKMIRIPLRNSDDVEEKICLLTLFESLEDLRDEAELSLGAEELQRVEQERKADTDAQREMKQEIIQKSKQYKEKRRISFAQEDQMLEFCNNEAVAQMLSKTGGSNTKQNELKRDIIMLDKPIVGNEVNLPPMEKSQKIRDKVEKSFSYFAEHQSQQDFDLVNKILDSSMGNIRTLHIGFKHSNARPAFELENMFSKIKETENHVPSTPADIFYMYLQTVESQKNWQQATIFINSYPHEDQVKAPILREPDRSQAYEDPKRPFSQTDNSLSNEHSSPIISTTGNKKSILRNKSAVQQETHSLTDNNASVSEINGNKKKKDTQVNEENTNAYYKVMNDVVEKPLTEPEPLPEVNYIDALAPKKRVSRFKQMRADAHQT